MKDQSYYNLVAGLLALGVVVTMVAWTGMTAAGAGASGASDAASAPAHMYLTVQLNPTNGMPQYSPANFTVPSGMVTFTIADFDSPIAWNGCQCNVTGTVGGVEAINGTAFSVVPSGNVAHSFTVPSLGISVLSPGNSTITFTLDLTHTGDFLWFCIVPCGSDGYTGNPMGELGYMSGTMTVA